MLLTNVYVDPAYAGGGLGRMLVQGMARDLIKRGGITAVEAFGDTRGRARRGAAWCRSDFLGSVGFKTQRAHPTDPADADGPAHRALAGKDEVEAALERLVGRRREPAREIGTRPGAERATRASRREPR